MGSMLLDGLRSCEVQALQLAGLQPAEAQMRVRGKGNPPRCLPLPQEIRDVREKWLHLERPPANSAALFVCLNGRHRGLPLTPAGLRTLFRHHRRTAQIPEANPYRFRHTFGADMAAARHLLEMYRRQHTDEKIRRTLPRLDRRMLAVVSRLDCLATAEK
jgi:site-specific recombinase XerD